jgi:hypothetical protein
MSCKPACKSHYIYHGINQKYPTVLAAVKSCVVSQDVTCYGEEMFRSVIKKSDWNYMHKCVELEKQYTEKEEIADSTISEISI